MIELLLASDILLPDLTDPVDTFLCTSLSSTFRPGVLLGIAAEETIFIIEDFLECILQ